MYEPEYAPSTKRALFQGARPRLLRAEDVRPSWVGRRWPHSIRATLLTLGVFQNTLAVALRFFHIDFLAARKRVAGLNFEFCPRLNLPMGETPSQNLLDLLWQVIALRRYLPLHRGASAQLREGFDIYSWAPLCEQARDMGSGAGNAPGERCSNVMRQLACDP